MLNDEPKPPVNTPTSKTVVRLTTSAWFSNNELNIKKRLIYLSKKSTLPNLLEEECNSIGADDCTSKITNLYTVPDGVYKIMPINISIDYELEIIDSYEFTLIPLNQVKTD